MSPFDDALTRYKIELPDEHLLLVRRYCHLVWDWNKRINLTRHTDFDRFVARDLTDSIALAKQLTSGEKVLDLGTGGGVPGVLLAILRPDLQVALCDSVGKKAKAVGSIVSDLCLALPVHHARAEDLLEDFQCDTVVARAVGPMSKVLRSLEPCWPSVGRVLLVKGPRWVEERAKARHLGLLQKLELRRVKSYIMPGTDSESVILQLEPKR